MPATKGERTRQAVLDLVRDGLDAVEIAERVGVTRNTVHKLLHYARREDPSVPWLAISARNRLIVRLALVGLASAAVAERPGASRRRVTHVVWEGRRRGAVPVEFRWAR